jgi:DNA-binding GntR family transcriptional regulator
MDLATTAPNAINTPTMPVTDLYTELRDAGCEDLAWTEYVTARPALPDEQVAMTLADTGPTVLITYRVTHHDERPLMVEQLRCSAARTSLAFPLTATRTKTKRPHKTADPAE